MKKNTLLLVGLFVLAIFFAVVAGRFWLQSSLEDQIRANIAALNASGADISIEYDKTALSVSPETRTVSLKSLVITANQPEMPVKVTVDTLTAQIASDMLLLDLDTLPTSGDVSLANHISLDNVSIALPDTSLSVAHHEMDNIICDASLLRHIVNGQVPSDMPTVLGQLGAERCESSNILYSLERSTVRLAISRLLFRDWKGQNIAKCVVEGLDFANDIGTSAQFARLQTENLSLPDTKTLSRISQQLSSTADLELALPAISDMLTSQTAPVAQHIVLDNLDLHAPEGDITLKQFTVKWPSVRPQNLSCELEQLALPTNAIRAAAVQEGLEIQGGTSLTPLFAGIDIIHANASFAVKAQDSQNVLLQEVIALDIREWGRLDYAHIGDYANPAVGGNFRDIRFDYTDNSLLARAALVFFPSGNADKQLAALLDSFATPVTAELTGKLKLFLANPGSLQIATLPSRKISESALFLIMANPADYFDITASPGSKSLEDQCKEIRKLR